MCIFSGCFKGICVAIIFSVLNLSFYTYSEFALARGAFFFEDIHFTGCAWRFVSKLHNKSVLGLIVKQRRSYWEAEGMFCFPI